MEKPQKVTEKKVVIREVPRKDLWGRMTGATVTDSEVVVQQIIKWQQVSICQFSWFCMRLPGPKLNDQHWAESLEIARQLLAGGYEEAKDKYSNALYFHSIHVRPTWAHEKVLVSQIGGHRFYEER
jgi:hypothetical protein